MQKQAENNACLSPQSHAGSFGTDGSPQGSASPEPNVSASKCISPFLACANDDLETSPYKSKFTVLKLTKSTSSKVSSPTKQLSAFSASPEKSPAKSSLMNLYSVEGDLRESAFSKV